MTCKVSHNLRCVAVSVVAARAMIMTQTETQAQQPTHRNSPPTVDAFDRSTDASVEVRQRSQVELQQYLEELSRTHQREGRRSDSPMFYIGEESGDSGFSVWDSNNYGYFVPADDGVFGSRSGSGRSLSGASRRSSGTIGPCTPGSSCSRTGSFELRRASSSDLFLNSDSGSADDDDDEQYQVGEIAALKNSCWQTFREGCDLVRSFVGFVPALYHSFARKKGITGANKYANWLFEFLIVEKISQIQYLKFNSKLFIHI